MNNYDDYCTKLFGEHSCTKEDCPTCPVAKKIAEHNSELLDKVMQKQRTIIDDDGVMYKVVFLKDIEEMKAEVE